MRIFHTQNKSRIKFEGREIKFQIYNVEEKKVICNHKNYYGI